MNPENRWIKKAALIPWDDIENRYAKLFPSNTGKPAKSLRIALGLNAYQQEAPYASQNITYQDVNLLNEARVNLERMIDKISMSMVSQNQGHIE